MLPVIAQLELVPFRVVDLRDNKLSRPGRGDDTTILTACLSVVLVLLPRSCLCSTRAVIFVCAVRSAAHLVTAVAGQEKE
jgi:hypothetical protein